MKCETCKGKGKIQITLPIPMEIICPTCNGTGKKV
ncbi:YuiA family protein [Desulfosporosinus sp.]|nr:YuiA family protein [Desulfosporosinus sp.]